MSHLICGGVMPGESEAGIHILGVHVVALPVFKLK